MNKILKSVLTIGVVAAVAVGAASAQFSDTEQATATFDTGHTPRLHGKIVLRAMITANIAFIFCSPLFRDSLYYTLK